MPRQPRNWTNQYKVSEEPPYLIIKTNSIYEVGNIYLIIQPTPQWSFPVTQIQAPDAQKKILFYYTIAQNGWFIFYGLTLYYLCALFRL